MNDQQGIKPYVIGLDLGGTNSVFGIVDARGEIKATTAIKIGVMNGKIEISKPSEFKITIMTEDHHYYNNTETDAVKVEDEIPNEQQNLQPDEPVPECFRNISEFVRQQVTVIVNDFYRGSAANLALIEIAFYDHGLLLKRNNHTAFVKTLVAWGTITCDDVTKTANSMAYKMRHLPTYGYKEWDGSDYVNDKKNCTDIGRKLDSTIPYSRKKVE